MRKTGTWLSNKWLAAWQQEVAIGSRWQRGKALFDQQQARELNIREGEITATIKEQQTTYQQRISCPPLTSDQLLAARDSFILEPSLVMLVYLKKVSEERLDDSLRALLLPTEFHYHCACAEAEPPCKHLAAVAINVASNIAKDPTSFMRFRGLDWDQLLALLPTGQVDASQQQRQLEYKLTPLPRQKNFQPHPKKKMGTPPFWISPFPFPLIMEEIYSKVQQEAHEVDSDEKK